MHETKRPLKVFLCHASVDKPKVRELYRYLRRRGVNPWFDEEHLVGGQDWQVEIPKALATSDAIIICLTKNSVDKEGYIQKEIKFALEKALEMPEGKIFLIPVKFEECEVPFSLSRYQWVDLTIESGYSKMMKALKFRASQLERTTVELFKKTVEEENLALEKATKEKVEREAIEKAVREKAEKESVEKARLEAEELTKQKVAKEKSEREVAEKVAREKAERQAAQKAAIAKFLSNAVPFIKVVGILGIIIGLIWVGSWVAPKFIALVPTPQATTTATQRPVARATSTNPPVSPTKTIRTNATPTKTRTPAPTSLPTEITDAKGVSMVLVPAGEFTVGWPSSVRKVTLKSYYIDKYEVTNAEYQKCVSTQQCSPPSDSKLGSIPYYGNSVYDSYPVVWVARENAEQYCSWREARVPSGEEWEKAARGTDQRYYPWGNQINDITLRANGPGSDDGFQVTAPVGSFPLGISPYGAFDMAGNVSEYITDNYVSTSTGTEGKLYPMTKGGDWYGNKFRQSDWSGLLSYYSDSVYVRNTWTGFRCVRDANP